MEEEVNRQDNKTGNSVLHLCAYNNDKYCEILKLLSFNADPNIRNKNNETPIHWCSKRNSTVAAKILIAGGADIMAIDNSGSNALHCSVDACHIEFVAMLLQNPLCNSLVKDSENNTALMIANRKIMNCSKKNELSYKIIISFLTKHEQQQSSLDMKAITKEIMKIHLLSSVKLQSLGKEKSSPIFCVRGKDNNSKNNNNTIFNLPPQIVLRAKERKIKINGSHNISTPIDNEIETISDINAITISDSPQKIISSPKKIILSLIPIRQKTQIAFMSCTNFPSSSSLNLHDELLSRNKSNKSNIHDRPPLFVIQTPELKMFLDCIITIEHCYQCSKHSTTLWHDESRYVSQSDACLKSVSESLLLCQFPVRLFAYKVTSKHFFAHFSLIFFVCMSVYLHIL